MARLCFHVCGQSPRIQCDDDVHAPFSAFICKYLPTLHENASEYTKLWGGGYGDTPPTTLPPPRRFRCLDSRALCARAPGATPPEAGAPPRLWGWLYRPVLYTSPLNSIECLALSLIKLSVSLWQWRAGVWLQPRLTRRRVALDYHHLYAKRSLPCIFLLHQLLCSSWKNLISRQGPSYVGPILSQSYPTFIVQLTFRELIANE